MENFEYEDIKKILEILSENAEISTELTPTGDWEYDIDKKVFIKKFVLHIHVKEKEVKDIG